MGLLGADAAYTTWKGKLMKAEYSNGQMVVTQVSHETINGKPYFKYLLRDFIWEPVVGDHYKDLQARVTPWNRE